MLLNADVGESWEFLQSGGQASLLGEIDLANVCCGAYAGDTELTRQTMAEAVGLGLRLGAHPGYEDRENFGRTSRFAELGWAGVADLVARQTEIAAQAAHICGQRIYHVKPHGALYNDASVEETGGEVAEAIAEGVKRVEREVFLVGLAGSVMLRVWKRAGFVVLRESFADRGYTPAGLLIPRGHPGALIEDVDKVLENLPHLAAISDTVCVHGDGPNAFKLAQAISQFQKARR